MLPSVQATAFCPAACGHVLKTELMRCSSWLVLVMLVGGSGCDKSQTPPAARSTTSTNSTATASSTAAARGTPTAKVHEKVVLSPVYEVDQVYKSMTGPNSTADVHLPVGAKNNKVELLWIVGFEAIMVAAGGKARESQQFMCH